MLEVTVNGDERRNYAPDSGEQVQRIFIGRPDISELRINLSHTAGFIGYGAVLEDSVGVSVHNFRYAATADSPCSVRITASIGSSTNT